MKKRIQDWLGITKLQNQLQTERNLLRQLENDFHDLVDHFQLQETLWPNRISARRISSDKIVANAITAPKLNYIKQTAIIRHG